MRTDIDLWRTSRDDHQHGKHTDGTKQDEFEKAGTERAEEGFPFAI